MRVLITGNAGLLGSHLSRHLLFCGHEVVGIDNLSGGYLENVPHEVKHYKIDLRHGPLVDAVVQKHKPDVVYHFAAYAAEGLSPFIRHYNYENNVLCSVNVVNSCVNFNVGKVVFTSSMAVYGEGKPPFTEDQIPSPEDPYGIAKYAVEMDLREARRMFGLDYTIVRPHNIIGEYQNIWDRYRNVIGIWIRQCLNGEPISIFGDGSQVRAFSDVQFYMEPFERLLGTGSEEIINLGADRYYTINEAADVVLEVAASMGYPTTKQYLESRKEVHTAYCEHSKARELLGFEDRTVLKDVVERMFRWAKTQPHHLVRQMNYEIEKGMYTFWQHGHSPSLHPAA